MNVFVLFIILIVIGRVVFIKSKPMWAGIQLAAIILLFYILIL